MAQSFDAAVIGLGTMGAFACLELARRNVSVVGLDQFSPPHDRGSHTGATRVFRTAYAEHPGYVPLAIHAGELWDELGARVGTTLLHRTGMLSLGPPESTLISGSRASAAVHSLVLQELSREEVRSRFPAFEVPAEWEAVFEPAAGWVDVDAGLQTALKEAARTGAELRMDTRVDTWNFTGSGFHVSTSGGSFAAKHLIVAAGAWAGRLLEDLSLPLRVVRKVLAWIDPLRPELFHTGVFPVFASAREFFYGFPNVSGHGVKLAIHWSEDAPTADTGAFLPEASSEEIRPVLEAAATLLPSLAGSMPGAFQRVIQTKTCLYTMTPDEHFIIDRHPHFDSLVFAAGFSGHGFKFAPAIGQALADLALHGNSSLPLGFLSLKRLRV